MRVHRVASVDAFPGLEAKVYDGRWHLVGDSIIYFASTAAGAVLEKIAHTQADPATLRETVWQVWTYDLPDDLPTDELRALPEGWQQNWPVCQQASRHWHSSGAVGLWVPSAVAPIEKNLLIKPERLDFQPTARVESFRPDPRLTDPQRRRLGDPRN